MNNETQYTPDDIRHPLYIAIGVTDQKFADALRAQFPRHRSIDIVRGQIEKHNEATRKAGAEYWAALDAYWRMRSKS